MQRILVVKLGDLGDLLLVSPAIAALKEAHPQAEIDLLVPPRSAGIAASIPYVSNVVPLTAGLDSPRDLLNPLKWPGLFGFSRGLRRARYDAVLNMQHMTTWFAGLKSAALCLASGAAIRAGLDNGRGWFLNRRVRNNGFGAKHEANYWLAVAALVGADPSPRAPSLLVTPEDEAAADRLLAGLDDRPCIALHLGTGAFAPARRWPSRYFIELAQRLSDDGCTIVLVGGADVRDYAAKLYSTLHTPHSTLNLTEQTTIPQLAAVLKRCDLYIGSDSGPMHVAAAAGVPVLGIFGPSNHRAWGPYPPATQQTVEAAGRRPNLVEFDALQTDPAGWQAAYLGGHAVIRQSLACSPCLYRHRDVGLRDGCLPRECLETLTPDAVYAAAKVMLGSRG